MWAEVELVSKVKLEDSNSKRHGRIESVAHFSSFSRHTGAQTLGYIKVSVAHVSHTGALTE